MMSLAAVPRCAVYAMAAQAINAVYEKDYIVFTLPKPNIEGKSGFEQHTHYLQLCRERPHFCAGVAQACAGDAHCQVWPGDPHQSAAI
jgi:ketosteroid isomerase-like protein